jgi:hypothetical protein
VVRHLQNVKTFIGISFPNIWKKNFAPLRNVSCTPTKLVLREPPRRSQHEIARRTSVPLEPPT